VGTCRSGAAEFDDTGASVVQVFEDVERAKRAGRTAFDEMVAFLRQRAPSCQAYATAGLQILELAQTAYSSYVARNPHEQARSYRTLRSIAELSRLRTSSRSTYLRRGAKRGIGSSGWMRTTRRTAR
jgi:hypothetical protein